MTASGEDFVIISGCSGAGKSTLVAELARLGFGIVQAPRYRFEADLASGVLVEVLSAHPPTPTPLAAFYPQNRQLSPRVRVFIDWVVGIFAAADI